MVPADPWPRGKITPAPFYLGSPFAGRGGAVVNLRAVDLSFRGEVWGRISGCRCPRREVLARRRGKTPVRISSCLLLLASAPPGLAPLPLDESETGRLGRDSMLPGQCDRPENFRFFGRIQFLFARFRYTIDIAIFWKVRIVARFVKKPPCPAGGLTTSWKIMVSCYRCEESASRAETLGFKFKERGPPQKHFLTGVAQVAA